jgi:drug/metabolite transporter (DMT)-like permease
MARAPIQRRAHLDAGAVALLVFLTALWGLQQVSVKVAVIDGLAPGLQAALRSVGAAMCVSAWIGWREGRAGLKALVARPALFPGLGVAVLFALEFLALFPGLHLTTASRGVVFLYSAPFFVALGAHLFIPGERLRAVQAAGLVLAFAGMAAAFAESLWAGGGSLEGDLLCLLGGALWASTTLCVRLSPALSAAPPATLLWLQLAGSAPILFAVSWWWGEISPWPTIGALGWLALFYQTVVIAFASYLAWFGLILTYPAARIAGFTFLAPVFGILAGWALLGERLSWGLFAGVVAIAIGMRMINTRPEPA